MRDQWTVWDDVAVAHEALMIATADLAKAWGFELKDGEYRKIPTRSRLDRLLRRNVPRETA